jgi:hypothetical protein
MLSRSTPACKEHKPAIDDLAGLPLNPIRQYDSRMIKWTDTETNSGSALFFLGQKLPAAPPRLPTPTAADWPSWQTLSAAHRLPSNFRRRGGYYGRAGAENGKIRFWVKDQRIGMAPMNWNKFSTISTASTTPISAKPEEPGWDLPWPGKSYTSTKAGSGRKALRLRGALFFLPCRQPR